MILAKRFITLAGASVKNPFGPDEPQRQKIQGMTGVRLDPTIIVQGAGPFDVVPDFWDFVSNEDFDKSGYITLYEAELYADNSIIVKRDLFGKNDLPHNFAGWPIPGDPEKPPAIAPDESDLAALANSKFTFRRKP